MTNKKKIFLFIGILISIIIAYLYLFSNYQTYKSTNNSESAQSSPQPSSDNDQTLEHVDSKLRPVERNKQSKNYVNKVSPDWKKKLEGSLKIQMGSELKDLNVRPLKPLILERDGHALHVQAVIITLKNSDNIESSFNAIIDSQTGKVLETWNQPVFEPELNSPPSP